MQIRPLNAEDAAEYRELRIASLRDHPTAFSTDMSEEASLPIEEFQTRLTPGGISLTFGAFVEGRLVGIGTLLRSTRLRQNFRVTIAAMYVVPSHRGRGIARQIIAACIEQARTMEGVEEVCLCVTAGNDAARRVYVACGFEPDCVDPRNFKYEGRYYDLEWLRFPLH